MPHKLFRKIVDRIFAPYLDAHSKLALEQIPALNQMTQNLLIIKYQELLRAGQPLPGFSDVEFRSFSQNGEDGILLYIFSLIGTTNKKAVEICAGNGIESNTANLIINHGWQGLLFDGQEKNIMTARNFYAQNKDTFIFPPTIVHAWITAENVNQLIAENGFSGDIDLLVTDLDGMDYWILQAITAVRPRLLMVEYHEEFGFEPVTVPYDPHFDRMKRDPRYHGASLPALVKLAKNKGYRLVGANRQKFNAFFLRNDIGSAIFPEVQFTACMRQSDPRSYTLVSELQNRFPFVNV